MAIRLIENRSEIGAGTRGASLGIDALRIASFKKESKFFAKHDVKTIKDANYLLLEDVKYPKAKRIEGIDIVFNNIATEVKETITSGDFPFILAADHASAGGTIAGIKKKFPNKRLGVIWVDAHADLHSPYTSPSGNVHGMPLATALSEDNKECKVNEVADESLAYWEKLKNCGVEGPKINAKDIVYYGVRDTEAPEDAIIERNGIKNFTVAECREKGLKQACEEGLGILKDCDIIYISFDVDSMDCDLVSMGTGTPVPNGFSPEEATIILKELIKNEKLVCFEMVEINPTLDNKQNLMAETSFDILEEAYEAIANKLK